MHTMLAGRDTTKPAGTAGKGETMAGKSSAGVSEELFYKYFNKRVPNKYHKLDGRMEKLCRVIYNELVTNYERDIQNILFLDFVPKIQKECFNIGLLAISAGDILDAIHILNDTVIEFSPEELDLYPDLFVPPVSIVLVGGEQRFHKFFVDACVCSRRKMNGEPYQVVEMHHAPLIYTCKCGRKN